MSILILRDGERVAVYHFKRIGSRKHIRGVVAFYKALYSGTGADIRTIVLGA